MDTIFYQWGILSRRKLKIEMIGFGTNENHKFDNTIERYDRSFLFLDLPFLVLESKWASFILSYSLVLIANTGSIVFFLLA